MRRAHAIALVSAALLPVAAFAAAPSSADDPRALDGHRFLVSHLIEDPFSATSFGMNLAYGTGQAKGPGLDRTTDPPTITASAKWYDYVTIAEQLDYTLRILENLSARLGVIGGVRQGAGEGSGLVVGTNFSANVILGLKGSLPVSKNLRLSLSTNVSYGPNMNLLILQGIREAAAAGGDWTAADMFKDRRSTTVAVTTAAAWAPRPWLGFIANASYLHAKSQTIEESSQNGYSFAGLAELDALPLWKWPIGANFGYRRIGGNLATQDEWGGGFYYTGRKNLSLGLEVDKVEGRLETELKSKQKLAFINFRYYW
jgi:hypothetical protein